MCHPELLRRGNELDGRSLGRFHDRPVGEASRQEDLQTRERRGLVRQQPAPGAVRLQPG